MPIINASEIVSDFQLIGVALLYKIYDIFPLPIVTTLDFFPCSKHDMPGSEVRSAFTHAAHETNEAESSSSRLRTAAAAQLPSPSVIDYSNRRVSHIALQKVKVLVGATRQTLSKYLEQTSGWF